MALNHRKRRYWWPVVATALIASIGGTVSFIPASLCRHSKDFHRFRGKAWTSLARNTRTVSTVRRESSVNGASSSKKKRKRKKRVRRVASLPERAYRIYADYAGRLWNETNPEARKRIANDKAATAVRQVQHIIRGDEYNEFSDISDETRDELIEACDALLAAMGKVRSRNVTNVIMEHNADPESAGIISVESKNEGEIVSAHTGDSTAVHRVVPNAPVVELKSLNNTAVEKRKKKPRRSILFGAVMGFAVACWVFSGNYIFTGLFTLMTILGQLEYYRMVISTGVYPARRITVVGACSMFLTALFTPNLHQICLPLFGLWAMIWFLTMKRSVATIPEIATTFTGMFYLGYVPSFWVRIRLIGAGREPTRLAPIAGPVLNFLARKAETSLPAFVPQAVHLPITTGAIFIFWTWLSLAFSDVGAYFVGKNFGKTKLGTISPAAGATSPNKTVEGVLGGCTVSAALSILGAWVQRWPYFWLTGAIHGTLLGIIGLIGDLNASMLKRDAGLKDFGDLIPEHGGIMDRVDGFIWTAPYSWLMCAYVIPGLKAAFR